MRIRYQALPDSLDSEIRCLIQRWRGMLPGWVDLLTVTYDDTDSDDYASANAMFDQRCATIAIHPLFWSLNERSRALAILHEIAHVLMAPLDQAVETIIQTRPKRSTAEKLYSDACEGFVNDFAALAWLTQTADSAD